jgi:hypothetical protein
MDTAFQIHIFRREVDDQYGVVIYRDPVDNPGDPEDVNDFRPLTANREVIDDYLGEVKASGGRDDPEDWVAPSSSRFTVFNGAKAARSACFGSRMQTRTDRSIRLKSWMATTPKPRSSRG